MKITRTNFYYIFCRRKCHAVLKNRLSTFKNSDVTVDLFSKPKNNLWTKFGNSGYGVYFCRKITRTNVFFFLQEKIPCCFSKLAQYLYQKSDGTMMVLNNFLVNQGNCWVLHYRQTFVEGTRPKIQYNLWTKLGISGHSI